MRIHPWMTANACAVYFYSATRAVASGAIKWFTCAERALTPYSYCYGWSLRLSHFAVTISFLMTACWCRTHPQRAGELFWKPLQLKQERTKPVSAGLHAHWISCHSLSIVQVLRWCYILLIYQLCQTAVNVVMLPSDPTTSTETVLNDDPSSLFYFAYRPICCICWSLCKQLSWAGVDIAGVGILANALTWILIPILLTSLRTST